MIFRKLISHNGRFWTMAAGRRGAAVNLGDNSVEVAEVMSSGTTTKPRPSKTSPHPPTITTTKDESPIQLIRREFKLFLEEATSKAATEDPSSCLPFTLDKMKEMLRKAVDVGDRMLFMAMLEAVPDNLLIEADPDVSLLSYCLVKLAEAENQAVQHLVAILSRLHKFDAFLCELVAGRIIEESDDVALKAFLSLVSQKQWPFSIDQGLEEQFINEVYVPNRNYSEIKLLLSKHSDWSMDTYTTVFLSMVNPDPTSPLEAQWSMFPAFVKECAKGRVLSAAIGQLFQVHHPPDHILKEMME